MLEEEQPEFNAMLESLRRQFEPGTEMQEIAFDQIVCCHWRVKLALRQEMVAIALRLGPAGPRSLKTVRTSRAGNWV